MEYEWLVHRRNIKGLTIKNGSGIPGILAFLEKFSPSYQCV